MMYKTPARELIQCARRPPRKMFLLDYRREKQLIPGRRKYLTRRKYRRVSAVEVLWITRRKTIYVYVSYRLHYIVLVWVYRVVTTFSTKRNINRRAVDGVAGKGR